MVVVLNEAQSAFGHIGAFEPDSGDSESSRRARAGSWQAIGRFTAALDELVHEVETIAPSDA